MVLQQCYVMTLATYSSTRGLRLPLTTIILLNRCPRSPCSYVTVKMQLVRTYSRVLFLSKKKKLAQSRENVDYIRMLE